MEKPNRLIKEKSPYLLQHAYNPVDWYPWGEEAFAKARESDKPVFLSIGYSTCHWCHVMEKESFEDEEIAAQLNAVFISIKVDREERPDIDSVYMTVSQMLTGGGGWPMTIIMTPDKKPFFAGTYFPKESRFGRPGMKELIPRIKELWMNKRNELLRSSEQITSALNSILLPDENPITEEIFKTAFAELREKFDEEYGGFGNAPKFPTPHNLMFLLRFWKRYNDTNALKMVEKTLVEMRNGGIYDHIGFGFSRYSTDREWLVPHFEKMLYDQALLVMAYTETYQVTKNNFYRNTAEEILTYVMRDMTSEEGGFYSAEDADSEGVEGKFYLWTMGEVKKLLDDEAEIVSDYFSIKDEGNWIDSVHGTKDNTNILHTKMSLKNIAVKTGLSEDELKEIIEKARQKLFNIREKRIHPYKDDKILTDWNALMISAFSKAAQVFNNKTYSEAAAKAADFIFTKMFDGHGRLLHRYREGDTAIYAYADDYAFFIRALLDLYETTFEVKYLKNALKLNDDFINHFWDSKTGGFFFTADYSEKLIARQKEIYDGAVPSGNSVAMLNLLRIARITTEAQFERNSDLINRVFSQQIRKYPSGFTQFLIALDFAIGPSKEIIISGKDFIPFAEYISGMFLPLKIILKVSSERDEIIELAPYLKNYIPSSGKTAVFICENYICNLPVYDIAEFRKMLK